MYICFCVLCKGSENRLDNQIFCEFNCVCNCNYCVFAPVGDVGNGICYFPQVPSLWSVTQRLSIISPLLGLYILVLIS